MLKWIITVKLITTVSKVSWSMWYFLLGKAKVKLENKGDLSFFAKQDEGVSTWNVFGISHVDVWRSFLYNPVNCFLTARKVNIWIPFLSSTFLDNCSWHKNVLFFNFTLGSKFISCSKRKYSVHVWCPARMIRWKLIFLLMLYHLDGLWG